ncbi:MAG TPA: class I SAM-dependent methyltransferase [Phycisphaerae bacterium]|nr:class I SAM-dependent methyltransferase [Phycisphaerae bacterium]HNU46886.1 class I SAM-dependent methyltransferase [Phycisphaerae bacterium]
MSSSVVESTVVPAGVLHGGRACLSSGAVVAPVGEAAAWFDFRREGSSLHVTPRGPLPIRCLLRPAGLFRQTRGFADLNTRMGQLLFRPGATEGQQYVPFTRDPQRELRELLLPVEANPHDELFASEVRWSQAQALAKRLLSAAGVPWNGLSAEDVRALLRLPAWQEPVEGCALHALTQWAQARGGPVLEVGSLHGQSTAMLALALRGLHSDAFVVSIDPHLEEPPNAAQVRLTLEQIGEQRRLVQFTAGSDHVWPLLRPGSASFIFIDGDHSYEQVVADFTHYRDLLAPGGCLAFHDYGYGSHNGRPDVVPGVRPALDEHVFTAKDFTPLLLAHTLMVFVKREGRE